MPKTNTTEQKSVPMLTIADLIHVITGVYTAPLWDELRSDVDSLRSLRSVSSAIKALQESGKSAEAFAMICALHDIAGIEVPKVIASLELFPNAVWLFVGEFIAYTDDLILDYEIEENDVYPE